MLLAAWLFLLPACHRPAPAPVAQGSSTRPAPFMPVFYDSLRQVFASYGRLREALALADTAAANAAALRMQQQLDSLPLDTLALPDDSLELVEGTTGSMRAELEGLTGEPSLAGKRDAFRMLSDMCLDLVLLTGLKGSTLYRLHDPGAANRAGAYWLNDTPAMKDNPYAGASARGVAITDTLHFE